MSVLYLDLFQIKLFLNIAKSEQSSHTPGGSHNRPYQFNWKERKMDNKRDSDKQYVAEFLYTVQLVKSDVCTKYQADMMEKFIGKKEKWTNKGTDKPYVADSLILSTSCHT